MATTLEITFVGLCLWARDRQGGDREYEHVLFIDHGDIGTSEADGAHEHQPDRRPDHRHPKHHARLMYSKIYEQPDFETHRGNEPVLASKNLAGKALYLGNPNDPVVSSRFPTELADLNDIAGTGHLRRAFVRPGPPHPPPGILSRITIHSGFANPLEDLAEWRNDCSGEPTVTPWRGRIAGSVEWVIPDLPDGPVALHFLALADESATIETVYLRPVDGLIRLFAFCSPFSDLPPTVVSTLPRAACERAEHFEGYYHVFPGAPIVRPGLIDGLPARNVLGQDYGVSSDAKPDMRAINQGGHSPFATLGMRKLFATPANPVCTQASCIVEP